ncbi:Ankyrin repeat [Dillenia turbinata]|uniref:Ankyrin repeat n=1 Tax=Dillenia turbinata TaxID=194707 RepID=A0AAN8ZCQ0_9MAGN
MGIEERTPLMIASMYGSTRVLKHMIDGGKVDVNRACGSDGVTALHCAAAGGSESSLEVVKLLLDASADVNSLDANGNKAINLIAPNLKSSNQSRRKKVEMLLKGGLEGAFLDRQEQEQEMAMTLLPKEGAEKKEYPIDTSLPDINNGIYGTDEFRMYSFKVKPCSRAYSHDWTECPFAHPGENAKRRDPRKYNYSCVPCPEFRKGSCAKGDNCEYAHGVFECWLHPAQYRTRLCKDEIGCARKVCFFAHKPEELRPLYASTGSAMPSPGSLSSGLLEMPVMSPLTLGSQSVLMPPTSTPPMSPSTVCSSLIGGSMWPNEAGLTPPVLQLPGSRLKSTFSSRDLDLEMELLALENLNRLRQQHLLDELSSLSPQSYWKREYNGRIGELKPTNLDEDFGSLEPSSGSQLQGLSMKATSTSQLQSPTSAQLRTSINQRAGYNTNLSSSLARKTPSYGFDTSGAVAAAGMNSKASAFANRSQSFIDRGATNPRLALTAAANSASLMSSNLSEWSSPDGKLDWGMKGNELNKLRKSSSFGFRSGTVGLMPSSTVDDTDVSWVHSLVKDVPPAGSGMFSPQQQGNGVNEMLPPWIEQKYIAHE